MPERKSILASIWNSAPLRTLLGAACLLGAVVSPAAAQKPGAGRLDDPTLSAGDLKIEARRATLLMAECFVRGGRSFVMNFIAYPAESKQARWAWGQLGYHRWCLPDANMKFSGTLLRGALFQALYLRDFGATDAGSFAAVPVIDYAATYRAKSDKTFESAVGQSRFGDCVVRANPVTARSLIRSKIGSPEELSSFANLASALNGCVTKGRLVNFSRSALRGLVAEGLYRLMAAKAGKTVSSNAIQSLPRDAVAASMAREAGRNRSKAL